MTTKQTIIDRPRIAAVDVWLNADPTKDNREIVAEAADAAVRVMLGDLHAMISPCVLALVPQGGSVSRRVLAGSGRLPPPGPF